MYEYECEKIYKWNSNEFTDCEFTLSSEQVRGFEKIRVYLLKAYTSNHDKYIKCPIVLCNFSISTKRVRGIQ